MLTVRGQKKVFFGGRSHLLATSEKPPGRSEGGTDSVYPFQKSAPNSDGAEAQQISDLLERERGCRRNSPKEAVGAPGDQEGANKRGRSTEKTFLRSRSVQPSLQGLEAISQIQNCLILILTRSDSDRMQKKKKVASLNFPDFLSFGSAHKFP